MQVKARNIEGENRIGGLTLLNFKTYYKVTVIKAIWDWQKKKKRQIHQWNTTKSLEIDPHKYIKLIFDKVGKAI